MIWNALRSTLFICIATIGLSSCTSDMKISEVQALQRRSAINDCPAAGDIPRDRLYGTWQAELAPDAAGRPHRATMVLEAHTEYEGVRGTVRHRFGNGRVLDAQVAGDVTKGQLALDESSNGRDITGLWSGELVENACGNELTGIWINATDDTEHPFTLRRPAAAAATATAPRAP